MFYVNINIHTSYVRLYLCIERCREHFRLMFQNKSVPTVTYLEINFSVTECDTRASVVVPVQVMKSASEKKGIIRI